MAVEYSMTVRAYNYTNQSPETWQKSRWTKDRRQKNKDMGHNQTTTTKQEHHKHKHKKT